MRVAPYRHVLAQGPGLAALARLAAASLRRPAAAPGAVPGEWLRVTVPAPDPALVRDYLLEGGGDPDEWAGELPPHLLARFGLPVAMQVVAGLPYPVRRTLNAGCAWTKRAPLPAAAALDVRARLETLDAGEGRVKAAVRIVAGTAAAPDALDAEMRVFIPLAPPAPRPPRAGGGRREIPTVPEDARLLARLSIGADAGAVFAALTGDFNPIHWLWPAARLAGFRSCILQGFAMHARAVEAVGAALPGGVRALRGVDVRFTRPLVLPAEVGVYARGTDFWLGAAAGAPANLVGTRVPETVP
jgi:acyl dehydratase